MPLDTPTPCLDCGTPTRPGPRCPRCTARQARIHNARRRTAPGDGAAARLRRAIDRIGAAKCEVDGLTLPSTQVEVDHVIPLADGGTDTAPNLQVLCLPHHREKTTGEATARRAGRKFGA